MGGRWERAPLGESPSQLIQQLIPPGISWELGDLNSWGRGEGRKREEREEGEEKGKEKEMEKRWGEKEKE